jgi:SecD/SecF fusion protein
MFRRNLAKLIATFVLVIWALASLFPLADRPFNDFIQAQVRHDGERFGELMRRAAAEVEAGRHPSAFMALKAIANHEKIDLSQFFPQIRLESSLRNIEKRNDILLDHLLAQSKGRLQLGLDLKGGVAVVLEVPEGAQSDEPAEQRREKLAKAIEIISNRINSFGVAEPIVRPVSDNRIEVQLPGVSTADNPEILDTIKKPARLDFRLVHRFASPANTPPGQEPPGYERMVLEQEGRGGETIVDELFVKRVPEMTGEGVADSYPVMDEFGRFKIILRFTPEGRARFTAVTTAIEEENLATRTTGRLAIVLDGRLYSAPTVRERIASDSAEITGQFTQREAFELANVLNNPLDLPLEVGTKYEVGPSLARDAVDSAVRAAIVGTVLVVGFMIAYYTVGGLVAVATLAVNVLIVLGVLASLGATLTLPGIAGIVLTIGMAVDANVLIFERIREELNLGKNLRAAFEAGFEKVFSTILDANLTTLITSAVMIAFGTGPVKGFGVTLTIGVFATMFSALVVTRMVLEFLIDSGMVKKLVMLPAIKSPVRDYLKYARPAFIASFAIVAIGVVAVVVKRDTIYGIDFVGGDELHIGFAQRLDYAEIRRVGAEGGFGEVNPLYQSELGSGRELLRIQTETGQGKPLFDALLAAHPEAQLELLGENSIGPAIGREIQWNAFKALGIAIIGILLYVAFRFEIGFGVGAVVATLHDILLTIGLFVLTDRQFTAPMVAAILLVAGYSINDTIVVFDRIREELKTNINATLRDIINLSIERVFSRSIVTSVTTLLAAFSLYLFGGGVINDLAFTFIVGIITGAFSSFFIASPIFYWWHKGDRKHVEDHKDLAPKYEWVGSSKASR